MLARSIAFSFLLVYIAAVADARSPNADFRFQNGRIFLRQGAYKDALAEFEIVLRLERKDAEAEYYIARVYLESPELRDLEKARGYYERAIRHSLIFGGAVTELSFGETSADTSRMPIASSVAPAPDTAGHVPSPPGKEEVTPLSHEKTSVEAITPTQQLKPPHVTEELPEEQPLPQEESEPPLPPIAESPAEQIAPVAPAVKRTVPEEASRPSLTPQRELSLPKLKEEAASPTPREELSAVVTGQDPVLMSAQLKIDSGADFSDLTYQEKLRYQVFTQGKKMWEIQLDEKEFDEAFRFADDIRRNNPKSWFGPYLMAWTVHEQGEDPTLAKEYYDMAWRLGYVENEDFPPPPVARSARDLFARSLLDSRNKANRAKWEDVETILLKLQNIDVVEEQIPPEEIAEMHYLLGRAALALKDYDPAIADFENAVEEGYSKADIDPYLRQAEEGKTLAQASESTQRPVSVKSLSIAEGVPRPSWVRLKAPWREPYLTVEFLRRLPGERREPVVRKGGRFNVEAGRPYQADASISHAMRDTMILSVLGTGIFVALWR